MPEELRMVKVHPFSYVMFDMESIDKGDIFIVPASDREELAKYLAPGEGEKIYDGTTGEGAAMEYIQYTDEDYYIYLGAGSVHLEDGKALAVAQELLALP